MAVKLITDVTIEKSTRQILPQHRLYFCGSCFSNNIGEKFLTYGFQTRINTLGILFNPSSITNCFNYLAEEKKFISSDFFLSKEIWYSYLLHSQHSGTELNKVIEKVNLSIKEDRDFLIQADFIYITLGTSFVFELRDTNQVVANCHKQDAQLFQRRLLSVTETQEKLSETIAQIRKLNVKAQIIATVSPIRHWRDGALQNQVSKSHLFAALYPLIQEGQMHYFPSYEIMMDELRDYRFYNSDMIHLSETAIDYIWDKLKQTYFNEQSFEYIKELSNIIKFTDHKPFNPHSGEYKLSVKKIYENLKKTAQKYDLDLGYLEQKIQNLLNQ